MIMINQTVIEVSQMEQGILPNEFATILKLMGNSSEIYQFESMRQLESELALRFEIIQSAILLNDSGVSFATFRASKCNERYWTLTPEGGFLLKPNTLPNIAIEDIFLNGSQYAFECAVAIVIIFYKAVLESIGKDRFNMLFASLYLYSWEYDLDLGIHSHIGTDFLPGDCVYFQNPDHDPRTPEWQGENAIIIDENLYFGHGIGITTSQGMIDVLNTKRRINSTLSAFLKNQITRPNFRYLSQFTLGPVREIAAIKQLPPSLPTMIRFNIGSKTYLL